MIVHEAPQVAAPTASNGQYDAALLANPGNPWFRSS